MSARLLRDVETIVFYSSDQCYKSGDIDTEVCGGCFGLDTHSVSGHCFVILKI